MARGGRTSQLPEEILDHILGLLPIQEAAKTAVLSTVWRDLWTTLTQLCFDDHFFKCFEKNYPWAGEYRFYVFTKILLQHKGTIRKCVINLSHARIPHVWSLSFDCDKWLSLVTSKGVQELLLNFGFPKYKLPNCIFSCKTLTTLHLRGFSIEPLNLPCTLPPNLTSLCLEYVTFAPTNVSNYVVDVPMLKNLSFRSCTNILHFKTTARNLCSLTINGLCGELDQSLWLNFDLKSIRTLDLGYWSLQNFLGPRAQFQPNALSVELVKLSGLCFEYHVDVSAFVCLLCVCPKLCELEITFSETSLDFEAIDATSKRLKKLCRVFRTYERLLVLKFGLFCGYRSQMLFIMEMLACVPSLERVIFMGNCMYGYESYKKHEIMEEVLCFPRASIKAKIVY
ncbi:unnamed protein product [Cuscuta epithymum]|uniref:F-box domain-containing protein n=1 Tax=Cuscuta epithymum TaxID=186058 RepID=A0AAV0EKZ7_9ASTE|nr:unnamed protein product [Cuscuta epithymum]CAH9124094.1 unnamed protein product [Cuscuta epithymum]